jgi:hypothetical protein
MAGIGTACCWATRKAIVISESARPWSGQAGPGRDSASRSWSRSPPARAGDRGPAAGHQAPRGGQRGMGHGRRPLRRRPPLRPEPRRLPGLLAVLGVVPGPLNAGTFGPNGIDPAVGSWRGTRTPNLLLQDRRGSSGSGWWNDKPNDITRRSTGLEQVPPDSLEGSRHPRLMPPCLDDRRLVVA